MSTTLAVVGPTTPDTKLSVITLQKARVKKGLLYAEFAEQTTLEDPARQFTMQGTQPIHDDLVNALAELVPHFVRLTEQLPVSHTADERQPFTVSGFSLSNKNGVTLSGSRTLSGGSVLNMTAPFVSFDEEAFEEYDGAQELEQAMSTVLAEVELALRGKCNEAGRQLALFEQQPEEAITEFGETTHEQPAPAKKRKARRVATPTKASAE